MTPTFRVFLAFLCFAMGALCLFLGLMVGDSFATLCGIAFLLASAWTGASVWDNQCQDDEDEERWSLN
jgi:hypothetical protein